MPRAISPADWAKVQGGQPVLSINTDAIYTAVSATAAKVVRRAGQIAVGSARERAPVRKVFVGGRRPAARFYSLAEAKLELPAFLQTEPRHPSGRRMSQAQALRQLQATPIATGHNRANSWRKTATDRNLVKGASGKYDILAKPEAFYGLTSRGRYELRSARAVSFNLKEQSVVSEIKNPYTGQVTKVKRHFGRFQGEGGSPRLGGSLRRSIETEDRSEGPIIKVSVVAGGEHAPYARFVEFGTRHAAAQPFLRPALKYVEGPFKEMMRAAFRGVAK